MSKPVSKKKKVVVTALSVVFLLLAQVCVVYAQEGSGELPGNKIRAMEAYIQKQMKKGSIPGLAVVVTKGDKLLYEKGFGYSDRETGTNVTPDTCFELGSNSKAFTALGILLLEEKGLIGLDDPVDRYLPWFQMRYKGEHRGEKVDGPVDITLDQLLHHTSGIPFKTIGDIRPMTGENALSDTVRAINGQQLDFYPGEKFLYATINYDVLGLVLQDVSGMPYEAFIKREILEPLGLAHTVLFREEAGGQMAAGYKTSFLKGRPYQAPVYRGNTPAGYVISNLKDMARWLMIQTASVELEEPFSALVTKSHLPDRSVAPGGDGSSYAAGWSVFQRGAGKFSHAGNNPNYSSFLAALSNERLGVAVLANLNSTYTQAIGEGILNILEGGEAEEAPADLYKSIDMLSVTIIAITVPMIAATLAFLAVFLRKIRKMRVKRNRSVEIRLYMPLMMLAFFGAVVYCLYQIPAVLFWELPWSFVLVWASPSLVVSFVLLAAAILVFSVYYYLTELYAVPEEKPIFPVTILSIMSGLGNAFIIFMVNVAMTRTDEFQGKLLLYFVFGIVLYIYGLRLVRTKLINTTNEIVYTKRIRMMDRVLNSTYWNFEAFEKEKIFSALNNDTETISNIANILVTGLTSLVTLVCCFIYLGIISPLGFLLSLLVIFLAAGLYFLMGRKANKLWEQTRDIQNVFFKFIRDMVDGFKELSINGEKRRAFRNDMEKSCSTYREKRVLGDMKFANVNVIGELLFTVVIGVAVFLFPIVFTDIQDGDIRTYVFVFLYMTGPVRGILGSIPSVFQVNISWKRINELEKRFEEGSREQAGTAAESAVEQPVTLELRDVVFEYRSKTNEMFRVGPINHVFHRGETTFVTGGNGSGKTTLAKLITGLYKPLEGEVLVNGKKTEPLLLGNYFSTIFSDYHLFDKLYGISTENKAAVIQEYLDILHIGDKVGVENGAFTTTALSAGQRKRLALLVSYLEERPMILFDEWAADQDPEFRRFFYHRLLPELKKAGKCIIAITHDDRYYDTADRILKMEMGQFAKGA